MVEKGLWKRRKGGLFSISDILNITICILLKHRKDLSFSTSYAIIIKSLWKTNEILKQLNWIRFVNHIKKSGVGVLSNATIFFNFSQLTSISNVSICSIFLTSFISQSLQDKR